MNSCGGLGSPGARDVCRNLTMVESDNASSAADDARQSKFGKTKGPRTQKPNNDANQQAAGDFLKLVFFDKNCLELT
jgi:hypothetical protein